MAKQRESWGWGLSEETSRPISELADCRGRSSKHGQRGCTENIAGDKMLTLSCREHVLEFQSMMRG